MAAALDAVDRGIGEGLGVYVHCLGGIGRTGTLVGCWLVRHGLAGDEALAAIAHGWKGVAKRWRAPRSPQTEEQHAYVRSWREPASR
jgi:protein-tyrosine phosphatase